jgi:hypothetical protein
MTTYDHAHERSLFLSDQQQKLLTAVVDRIIPPVDGLPGTGELGVAEHVEGISGVSTQGRSLLANGLKAIEATSDRSHSKAFADLSNDQKTDVLREVESQYEKFFKALVQETYSGYYSHPAVLRAKKLPLSAPQPVGYEVEPFDMSLLEPVRNRGKAYRDA